MGSLLPTTPLSALLLIITASERSPKNEYLLLKQDMAEKERIEEGGAGVAGLGREMQVAK